MRIWQKKKIFGPCFSNFVGAYLNTEGSQDTTTLASSLIKNTLSRGTKIISILILRLYQLSLHLTCYEYHYISSLLKYVI